MENENNTTIFGDGFYFDRPRPNSPEFVKGRLSINIEKAIPFLQRYANEKKYVNLDLLKAKERDTLYLKLDTFKPKPKEEKDDSFGGF